MSTDPFPATCAGVDAGAASAGSLPYSNHACVGTPRGLTEPSNVAPFPVICVEEIVSAVDGTTTESVDLPTAVPLVATICVLPTDTLVTRPVGLTVATPVLVLDHVTGRGVGIRLPSESN